MKILIAIDSFKGTLSSSDLGVLIKENLQNSELSVNYVSVSDGGEGLLDALSFPLQLKIMPVSVTDPLGKVVETFIGYSKKTETLVVELASASGLPLVPEDKRNPLKTTTFGSGELLNFGKKLKCKNILFGVGGSATSDGGVGALQALGLQFSGVPIPATGEHLIQILNFEKKIPEWLQNINFQIACDVNNPFTGVNGSAKIYCPQKCSTQLNIPNTIEQIEQGMLHFKNLIQEKTGIDLNQVPGSGAAGGIAGSMHALLNAKLIPGIQIIFEAIQLTDQIKAADVIITGEGRLDEQTKNGKVVAGIIKEAARYGKAVWVICGQNLLSQKETEALGVQKVFTLTDYGSLKDCLENTQSIVKKVLLQTQMDLLTLKQNKK